MSRERGRPPMDEIDKMLDAEAAEEAREHAMRLEGLRMQVGDLVQFTEGVYDDKDSDITEAGAKEDLNQAFDELYEEVQKRKSGEEAEALKDVSVEELFAHWLRLLRNDLDKSEKSVFTREKPGENNFFVQECALLRTVIDERLAKLPPSKE